MTDKVLCMFFNHKFKEKPQGAECGWVQKKLTKTDIEISDLANALTCGASFKPAVLVNGNKAECWESQQLFALDFDDGVKIEEAYQKAVALNIKPCFMYTTFSHKKEHHKFRMIFCTDMVITNGALRDKLQITLMNIMDGTDERCFNRDRLFFGGKSGAVLHADYQTRINADDIINRYWSEDFNKYISKKQNRSRPQKTNKNNDEYIISNDNIEAIRTLDIKRLRDILTTKGDKTDTDKENIFSLLVSPLSSNPCESMDAEGKIYFSSEAELYQYISSLDLHTYLGVSGDMFNCILPTHNDSTPSANIYTTDDGTQIYKCFGCNQSRTIISITEQLAHCRRSEAINFIKQVYNIEYKPSEWAEEQRKLLINSALYLDSEDFKNTFPHIDKLIRTRKADIKSILLHMTEHISDNLQYEGKPLFFASLTSLMKICDRKNKNIMSQSVTLFALLNMLNKVDLNCIPDEELNKAKQISAKYGFKKLVNFYQFEEYGYTTLENSENIAKTLLDNNITFKGLSREYVLRTFGAETADKVFPQYKFENKQGASAKSDKLTLNIACIILKTIERQGFIFEKDINKNNSVGIQWKKSIQEILDSYDLKRVKLNKGLKESFNIECGGYPYIIIENK